MADQGSSSPRTPGTRAEVWCASERRPGGGGTVCTDGHEADPEAARWRPREPSASVRYNAAAPVTTRRCRRGLPWTMAAGRTGKRRTDPGVGESNTVREWTVNEIPSTPRCYTNRWIKFYRPRLTSIYNHKNPSSVFLARLRPRGEGHHAPGSPRAGGIPAAAEHAGVPDPPCRSRSARLERDPLPRRAHVQRIRRDGSRRT